MLDVLPISVQLRIALEETGVGIALWKSNEHMNEALAGKTDLDMLVKLQDRLKFLNVMRLLGAKKILSQPWARYPCVEDWLLMDGATFTFLHLHVHFEMVTGLKRVKHLRLPWVDAMFANLRVDEQHGWPIPTAEMELLILLVRLWAKMPPLRRLFAPKIPMHVDKELRWLERQANATRINSLATSLGLKVSLRLPLGDDRAVIKAARKLYSQLIRHSRVSWPAALVFAASLNLRLAATRFWLRWIGPVQTGKLW